MLRIERCLGERHTVEERRELVPSLALAGFLEPEHFMSGAASPVLQLLQACFGTLSSADSQGGPCQPGLVPELVLRLTHDRNMKVEASPMSVGLLEATFPVVVCV